MCKAIKAGFRGFISDQTLVLLVVPWCVCFHLRACARAYVHACIYANAYTVVRYGFWHPFRMA